MIHDLITLVLERDHPVIDRRALGRAVRHGSLRDPGDFEEIAELGVGQLHEQIREELASVLPDHRILQRPRL